MNKPFLDHSLRLEKLAVEIYYDYVNNYMTVERMAEDKLELSVHYLGSERDEKLACEALRSLIVLGSHLNMKAEKDEFLKNKINRINS